MSQQGASYSVDIVLCIDQTGSMHSIIDRVKTNALSFSDDLRRTLDEKDKHIDSLRVRVIGFRDYKYSDHAPMEVSEFFALPDENAKFSAFVSGLTAAGGGDEPESGLEALALAINSKWTSTSTKSRQLIVVWTDASADPLEKNSAAPPSGYPTSIPKNLDELTDWWEGQSHMNHSAKRLIIYAPDAAGWSEIGASWDKTVHFPSKAGDGLSDHEYGEILDSIANSV
ncbi:vWA domain-containing protein [Mycolicibacterium llatzerense]|uniref:vWA domain-containing protein n=1 Tax=Mycolicibacterium llatzerense TaxID=280871 RepID=UPI00195519CB|nr:vWA domain-containing protein [Mycolicibacterium llatzerense]